MHDASTSSIPYYNYSYELPFEQEFDEPSSTKWMQRNWMHSFSLSLLYVVGIYVGEYVMRQSKSGFDLKWPLFLWNAGLAIFSIMGVWRMSPEFFHVLFVNGFEYSMCNASFAHIGVTGYWTQAFALSKVIEFGDTAFIVVRKRPIIFLHWYHHITVLMYTWHAYQEHCAAGRWFIWMNYTVHAVMYTYYALRAIGVRGIPKWVPLTVTTMQLAQMVAGCVIALNSYYIKTYTQRSCQQSYSNLYFSASIYGSYFLLFAHFFYKAYLCRSGKHTFVAENGVRLADKFLKDNCALKNGHPVLVKNEAESKKLD